MPADSGFPSPSSLRPTWWGPCRWWFWRAGPWRMTYTVGAVLATYLNVFVLVAQLFKRIPVLFLLAPTQSEPPFALTQVLVLALFVWLGGVAVRGFRPARSPAPPHTV